MSLPDPQDAARRPVEDVLTDLRVERLRRLFDAEAYSNHLAARAVDVLRRAFGDVARLLADDAARAPLSPRDTARLTQLGRQIIDLFGGAYADAAKATATDLVALAALDVRTAAADLNWLTRYAAAVRGQSIDGAPLVVSEVSLVTLTRTRVDAIAALPLVRDGRDLGQWWADTATTMTAQTRRELQTGLVLGETTQELTRRIAPAAADDPTQPTNVFRRARRDAKALVRTAVTAVQSDAAVRTYTQATGVARVRISAVLDARTTVLCASLDGREYATDDPQFVPPPYHVNCRTGLTPVVDWAALGILPPPRAAELANPEPARGYEAWLRGQPEAVQRQVLGATRAALFRDGSATLADFVTQERRVLTVRELAQRAGVRLDTLDAAA